MIVYRISKKDYCTDLNGEGARLFGGRWNTIGTPCLYASETRALALLEYSVHITTDLIANNLRFILIEIPDNEIEAIKINTLPKDWNVFPFSSTTQLFGTNLLLTSEKSVLKIPSTIISKESNYLLNPRHRESGNFKIIGIEDFEYDVRIKK